MFLKIDTNRSLPLFGQIMEGIRLAIATGRLKSGDRVPSIHDLAVENRINPNTVARAYMELERAGVIQVKRGFGHFVAEAPNGELADQERRELLDQRIEELLTAALELGYSPDEVKVGIDRKVERLHTTESGNSSPATTNSSSMTSTSSPMTNKSSPMS